MSMDAGSAEASSGMSKAIYTEMDKVLSPPLVKAVDDASEETKPGTQKALDEARRNWKQMSFAIATGVIAHLKESMEITGIQTSGDVSANVSGSTGPIAPGPHVHTVALTATQQALMFKQTGSTLGHVK